VTTALGRMPVSGGLAALTAVEIIDGYLRKAFTPRDVMEETIAAPKAVHAACNVVVTPMYEQARAEADRFSIAMRAGDALPPLAGVPVTIKDLVFVAGVPALGRGAARSRLCPRCRRRRSHCAQGVGRDYYLQDHDLRGGLQN
jgi:aspartyl-tRNA(Asn)/glutamyl-tRNA(Gln) amidotransferase subunit A